MTSIKTPILYTGEGSAIDNYLKPKSPALVVEGGRTHSKSNWGLFDNNDQQHRTILSHMRTAQWVVPNDKWGEVPDTNRLSEFLKSDKSPVNKPLKKMKPQEVSKVIEAFKGIVKSLYK